MNPRVAPLPEPLLTRPLLPLLLLLASASAATGCAESRVVTGADGGPRADTGRVDAGASPVCPATPPSVNDDCATEGLFCSYGDSLDPRCRARFECVGSVFQARDVPSSCGEPAPTSCAATPPLPGTTCTASDVDDVCEYPDTGTVCDCVDVLCGGPCQLFDPPQWVCHGPPATPGCPVLAPNFGDACGASGLECRYLGGGCQGGVTVRCEGGYFQGVLEICPL